LTSIGGIGTISHLHSTSCQKGHRAEIVPDAIEDAKVNAQINCIANTDSSVPTLPQPPSESKASVNPSTS
jgi:tRNA/tmRNA/rRNA uracil-C5-methylase (TrmA/RlmC/RlmD family)